VSDSHNKVYQGLLIDWGGVLTTDVFASFSAFCEREGLAADAVARSFREDRAARGMLVGLENGSLSEIEFETQYGAVLGVDPEGLIDRLFAASASDLAMIEAVRRAHQQGVKTGLISNSWSAGHYDQALLTEVFDGVVLSAQARVRKPSPQIYELGLAQLGLRPEECVFVDDLPFNLEPAREMGMGTVHHVTAAQTIAELEPLLGVSLR
jgi:putative hydrolase of the HAD superfamily